MKSTSLDKNIKKRELTPIRESQLKHKKSDSNYSSRTAIIFFLLIIPILFLIPQLLQYGFDPDNYKFYNYFLVISIIGIIIPSFIYLKLIFTGLTHKHRIRLSNQLIMSSVLVIAGFGVGIYWYSRVSDVYWFIFLICATLAFLIVPMISNFIMKKSISHPTESSKIEFISVYDRAILRNYLISLVVFIVIIGIVSFPQVLLIFFWFIIPIHSVAVLVLTITSMGSNQNLKLAATRLILALIFVVFSFNALTIVAIQTTGA